MSTATQIFIRRYAENCYLLIVVLDGRGKAYWAAHKDFPTAEDVQNCLATGEGLPQGGVDAMLAQVEAKFLAASTQSYQIDQFKNIVKAAL